MIYVSGIQTIREYCKQNFKLEDSSVKKFTKQFIMNETKIPLEDTLILQHLDNQFNKYSFFADSFLDKFRNLGVRNFFIKYFNNGIIKDRGMPISMIAFLFENRIFWNNETGRIPTDVLEQIERSCEIKWDHKNKKWIDLIEK